MNDKDGNRDQLDELTRRALEGDDGREEAPDAGFEQDLGEGPKEEDEEPKPKRAKKKAESDADEEADSERKAARKLLDAYVSDEGEETHINWSLSAVLGGDILNAKWFRRHAALIIMILIFTILYITNRYAAQQNLIQIDALNKELTDKRYDALSRSSQLMQRCRQSKIIEYLKTTPDSTIEISTQPPYVIPISGEE